MDFTYPSADDPSDYPMSGLAIVECSDGRWFIEQDFGTEYSQFPGVVKSGSDLETLPEFYPEPTAAANAAFALIQQVYPTVSRQKLDDFLLRL
jgi:hypothetical protein